MKRILFLILLSSQLLSAQRPLSSSAEISLITCGPGQNELYSAFGHSAVRVKDPAQNIDWVFNYGIFDFDQPNFYLNFARGHLLYMLALTDWQRFQYSYQREGRFIHEQVLDLDSLQAQAYFEFLWNNARPENRDYYYDYFYDNCATRVRDGLEIALGSKYVQFSDSTFYQPALSIRELCDEYLVYQAWGDLGIDLCLGLPMDKQADARIEMFLPDLLEAAFAEAVIIDAQGTRPLVRESRVVYPQVAKAQKSWWRPLSFFAALLVLGIILSWRFYKNAKALRFFDGFLFALSGLLGLLLLLLWLFTDHKAAAYNFNILLFLPSHLLLVPAILRGRLAGRLQNYLKLLPVFYALLAISWFWLPQQLHLGLYPLALLLLLRSWHLSRQALNTKKA
ncbi:DUF4105 domain-containing protein [Croceimicrobium sp.]|uniref:lipoprotein N-acyltransferase Lnb domain-containing protein n=1 Tax=Croceimicrobium sp. TaxID=2828340 RepID=UPI003BAC1AD6